MRGSAEQRPVSTSAGVKGRVRFATFVLDADDESLWSDGARVSLRGKSFAVLCVLAGAAGRLVTREQLLAEVWPDATIHEQGLSVCIKEVRAALGDDPREPRFVETVHRRGYRFLAEVTALEAEGTQAHTVTHDESANVSPSGVRCVFSRGLPTSHDAPLLEGAREVGRGPLGSWTLDDGAVSRRHVRVTYIRGVWRVEDCGSKNGSFVDGAAVKGTIVEARAGAVVRIGETLLVLLADLARPHPSAAIVEALAAGTPRGNELRASFVERALLDPHPRTPAEWRALAERAAEAGSPLTAAAYPSAP